jgi:hypothetical protein
VPFLSSSCLLRQGSFALLSLSLFLVVTVQTKLEIGWWVGGRLPLCELLTACTQTRHTWMKEEEEEEEVFHSLWPLLLLLRLTARTRLKWCRRATAAGEEKKSIGRSSPSLSLSLSFLLPPGRPCKLGSSSSSRLS